MTKHSEVYRLLQGRVEVELATLLKRGFRILEEACSDQPTGSSVVVGRERAWVGLSFDVRDRVGSLYLGKLCDRQPSWPGMDLVTYLERYGGFRGRVFYELTIEQRRGMSFAEIIASDSNVLATALLRFAPHIVDDTEEFVPLPAPGM